MLAALDVDDGRGYRVLVRRDRDAHVPGVDDVVCGGVGPAAGGYPCDGTDEALALEALNGLGGSLLGEPGESADPCPCQRTVLEHELDDPAVVEGSHQGGTGRSGHRSSRSRVQGLEAEDSRMLAGVLSVRVAPTVPQDTCGRDPIDSSS
ncbi:hypothetical protein GCM10025864_31910 [Luteimicrobium album]|uniref:Uncharacterized protein n=1 Tax=Luteimicrobium album TaxID=1054550 RepID=A0ABQ6I4N0_9MICO|nr:hypothetical protein GCM10025864_31910 [Luteimicrobium album]